MRASSSQDINNPPRPSEEKDWNEDIPRAPPSPRPLSSLSSLTFHEYEGVSRGREGDVSTAARRVWTEGREGEGDKSTQEVQEVQEATGSNRGNQELETDQEDEEEDELLSQPSSSVAAQNDCSLPDPGESRPFGSCAMVVDEGVTASASPPPYSQVKLGIRAKSGRVEDQKMEVGEGEGDGEEHVGPETDELDGILQDLPMGALDAMRGELLF